MHTSGAGTGASGGASVHLLGTFDLANFGDLILPAVTEHELLRRLPDLRIRRFSPYGWEHPVPMDAGELAEPLGAPTLERRAAVARCDAVVIGGGEILHFHDHFLAPHYDVSTDEVVARAPSTWFVDGTGDAAPVPTAWNAVGIPFDFDDAQADAVRHAASRHGLLVVRDSTSQKRLEQVGIDQEIAVVPDPGFLVHRLWDPEVVARRRRLHATLGWTPPGRYVVVQGNGSMLNEVDRIGMALDAALADRPDLSVVVLETGAGHGDAVFAASFEQRYPGRTWRPSAPLLPVDLVAILAGAETSIAASLHAAVTVLADGRRPVVFNAPNQTKLRGLVDHLADRTGYVEVADELPDAIRWALTTPGPDRALGAIERSIDAHFDRLAAFIESAHANADADSRPRRGRGPDLGAELRALRVAHAARGRRLLAERDALSAVIEVRDREIAARDEQVAERDRRVAALEHRITELEAAVTEERDRTAAAHSAHDAAQVALGAVHATKTLRWLYWPRRAYSWLRR